MPGRFYVSKIWFAREVMTWTGDHNIANSSSPVFQAPAKNTNEVKRDERQGGRHDCEEFLPAPICDLKRKAEPQTNRASIVYALLRVADVVATKVQIGIHIDNDKLARLHINIEVAEQCE